LSKLPKIKIIFVCGKNAELREKISALNYGNVIPLGFYSPMDELYAVADVFVGKPGGLSTAESLRWNLPLIVCYTLPGQEEKNLKYLSVRGLVVDRPSNLARSVEQELATGVFKESLRQNPYRPMVFQEGEGLVLAVRRAFEQPI
jgi:UDP-N-acetylglucosamine:LPS N-acetylglucosamine transferase